MSTYGRNMTKEYTPQYIPVVDFPAREFIDLDSAVAYLNSIQRRQLPQTFHTNQMHITMDGTLQIAGTDIPEMPLAKEALASLIQAREFGAGAIKMLKEYETQGGRLGAEDLIDLINRKLERSSRSHRLIVFNHEGQTVINNIASSRYRLAKVESGLNRIATMIPEEYNMTRCQVDGEYVAADFVYPGESMKLEQFPTSLGFSFRDWCNRAGSFSLGMLFWILKCTNGLDVSRSMSSFKAWHNSNLELNINRGFYPAMNKMLGNIDRFYNTDIAERISALRVTSDTLRIIALDVQSALGVKRGRKFLEDESLASDSVFGMVDRLSQYQHEPGISFQKKRAIEHVSGQVLTTAMNLGGIEAERVPA